LYFELYKYFYYQKTQNIVLLGKISNNNIRKKNFVQEFSILFDILQSDILIVPAGIRK